MDVVMPDQSGLEVVPTLLHEQPEAKVLVLSMQDDPRYVREAFAGGRERLRAQGGGRHRGRRGDPRGRAAAAATSIRSSARGSSPPRRRGASGAPRRTRSRSASARCCACSRSATRTRRSRSSSTSRCARPRRTARTSCRSSGSAAAPSSCATRSTHGLLEDCIPRTNATGRPEAARRVRAWCVDQTVGDDRARSSKPLVAEGPSAGSRLRSAPPTARIAKPMSGEQQRDSDDDPEERELLGHVARVERGRQRRLGDPEVAQPVVDGALALRVDERRTSRRSCRRDRQ